jgi:hypothetical protein
MTFNMYSNLQLFNHLITEAARCALNVPGNTAFFLNIRAYKISAFASELRAHGTRISKEEHALLMSLEFAHPPPPAPH